MELGKNVLGLSVCLNVLTCHFTICLTASGFHRGEGRIGDPVTGGQHALNVRVASSSATVDIIIIIKNKQIQLQSPFLKIAR